jgi:hypothetical protein
VKRTRKGRGKVEERNRKERAYLEEIKNKSETKRT